jgi:hypothetical protein
MHDLALAGAGITVMAIYGNGLAFHFTYADCAEEFDIAEAGEVARCRDGDQGRRRIATKVFTSSCPVTPELCECCILD